MKRVRLGLSAVVALSLAGCATGGRQARAPAPPPCRFAACGIDRASLALVTAKQVGVAPAKVAILQVQPQFSGAVLVWRAAAGARTYDCREGRDRDTGAVHYLDCRLSDGGPLKAFP